MRGVNWLLQVLLMVMVMVMLAKKVQSQADSTSFNFPFFNGRELDLIYQGDAYIPWDNSRTARLTRVTTNSHSPTPTPLPNRFGRLLFARSIRLWDRAGSRQASFQTTIRCSIVNPWSSVVGDGITFFVAPPNTTFPLNSVDGNMGLYDSWSGASPVPILAVELDNFFRNPWDPGYFHLGINTNSRNSVAVSRWNYRSHDRVVEARINYDARARRITVGVSDSTSLNSILEHSIDLKTLLPERVQIGISASTGSWGTALQDIEAWSFSSFMVPDDHDTRQFA